MSSRELAEMLVAEIGRRVCVIPSDKGGDLCKGVDLCYEELGEFIILEHFQTYAEAWGKFEEAKELINESFHKENKNAHNC